MATQEIFKIVRTKFFIKQYNKQNEKMKNSIDEAFEEISCNPYPHQNIKRLSGELARYYRYKLGSYRLVYEIKDDILVVVAVFFGSRGDVYKHL